MDSYVRERRGLAVRKMYSTSARWTTANPIIMHLVSKNDELGITDFQKHLELSPGKKGAVQLPDVGILTLEELEVLMIKKAMEFHKKKVSRAAASLGLTRSALYRRLDKFQIPYDEEQD